jgi:hypothetical protein
VTTAGEPSKQATEYLYQLAGEFVAKQAEVSFSTPWMERGTQLESEARKLYELVTGEEVKQCGLVYLDHRRDRHASPDGMMENKGLEIKCPKVNTHVGYLLSGKLPTAYFQQVQGGMYITGFPEWSFISYFPGLPMFKITVERNEAFIEKLHNALEEFCGKLSETINKLRAMQ